MSKAQSEAPPDARATGRTRVRRIGWLSKTKGESLRECVVFDESEKGARLVVNSPGDIPDTFYLYMTLDFTSRRRCRVAWRSATEIGVEYLADRAEVRGSTRPDDQSPSLQPAETSAGSSASDLTSQSGAPGNRSRR